MVKFKIITIFVVFLITGCSGTAVKEVDKPVFTVKHIPNPTDIHEKEGVEKKQYPSMWFYRTEVKNVSNKNIKILWFWGHSELNGQWSHMDKPLGNKDFLKLYSSNPAAFNEEGYILPGEVAVYENNWYGSNNPLGFKVKWSYVGIDRYGNEYFVESYIEGESLGELY